MRLPKSPAILLLATFAFPQSAMFRGNLQHTGVYSPAPNQYRTLKWKFHTDGGVFSSAAVANGVIYIGSNDHYLYAVNLDGTLKWKFKTKSRVASSPAIANGIIYFGSWDSNFYAVDASGGQLKWQFQTGWRTSLHGDPPARIAAGKRKHA